jgi:hypothetical protein
LLLPRPALLKPYANGQLELTYPQRRKGARWRGQIASLSVDNGELTVRFVWNAVLSKAVWANEDTLEYETPIRAAVATETDGCLTIKIPIKGMVVMLFPLGHKSNIDRAAVLS